MFGNNGMQFAPQDWQQMALTAGLSMLGNNDGSRSVGQLIGQGGLDALAGLHARKQYEQAMARQQMLDEREQAQHDMQMQKGQAELAELERVNKLKARYASGDRSPEVMNGLYGKEMLTHELAMKRFNAEQKAKLDADAERRANLVNVLKSLGGKEGANGSFALSPAMMATLASSGPEGKAILSAMTQAHKVNAGVLQEEAKGAQKYIERLIEDRANANASIQQYDALENLLQQGMKTGMLEKYKNNFGGFLEAVGASPELIASFGLNDPAMAAAFNSLQMTNVMNVLAKQKGVQTEGDAERASKTWANIQNTEEGNRWVNQYHRNIAERSKERAYFLEDYLRKNGYNIGEAERAWDEYQKKLGSVVPPMPKSATPKKVDLSAMSNDELLRELNGFGGASF